MNKKTSICIGVVIAVIVIICLAVCLSHKGAMNSSQNVPPGKLVTGTPQETFSGTITAVNTGCFVDGICSVSVDGKKVIVEMGRMMGTTTPVVGHLIGVDSIGDLQQHIGDHANVYATTTPDGGYSLYGNNQYYVEVVKLK